MIPKYQKILYTTNLSPHGQKVFRHALGIAQRYQAKIHVIHVVPEMDTSHQHYVAALIGEAQFKQQAKELNVQIAEKLKQDLRDFVETELKGNPEHIKAVASVEVLHGHPAERILERADELNADLLVFGPHEGEGGVSFLGSVVKRVLRRSRRPVLVVPVCD